MENSQELAVQKKKELQGRQEKTIPARYFVPTADIFETADALAVVMEVPGVEKKDLEVSLEQGVLRVEGRIDFAKYEGFEPVYSEYNVGHYSRMFTLSDKIDPGGITAELADGVLTLTLKKVKEAAARRIEVK
jgi:HSP20 family molecular chaperone IbpA